MWSLEPGTLPGDAGHGFDGCICEDPRSERRFCPLEVPPQGPAIHECAECVNLAAPENHPVCKEG